MVTTPFSFVASANAIVFERAKPVFADIDPVTLNLDPAAAAAAITGRTTALLPVAHLRLPGGPRRRSRRHGLPIVEDACEALGGRYADGAPIGGRGHPATFGFYANKQLTTGEGGMITMGSAEHKERVDSERNQGRAPEHGLARPRPAGLQLPAQRHRLRARAGAARPARRRCSPAARASPRWYREALADSRGLDAAVRGHGRRGPRLVRVRRPAPARDSTATRTIEALREHGVQSKPYLPAIHLMSYYREAFGHREGEFPVCEDVAARSVALPFFPAMPEGQVARVAEALTRRLRAGLR